MPNDPRTIVGVYLYVRSSHDRQIVLEQMHYIFSRNKESKTKIALTNSIVAFAKIVKFIISYVRYEGVSTILTKLRNFNIEIKIISTVMKSI